MLPVNELFTAKDKEAIYSFLDTYPRYLEILEYRKLPPKPVKTVFYGDSITNAFPFQEFFPGASFLNRGIGGDNVNGLYFRLEDDVFPFHDNARGKTITIMMQVDDEPGLLSKILSLVAKYGANILTIHQTIPVNQIAMLTLSVEILPTSGDVTGMMNEIEDLPGLSLIHI